MFLAWVFFGTLIITRFIKTYITNTLLTQRTYYANLGQHNYKFGRLQELTEHCKLLKNLSWRLPVECFHWSRIDPMINLI